MLLHVLILDVLAVILKIFSNFVSIFFGPQGTLNTLRARSTIYSYFTFRLKDSSFRLPYQRPSSSADCARELFKDSNGSASLVDCTRKKFFG